MDKTISIAPHLKEMDYMDLVWLLTSESVDDEFYQMVEVELTLRDIRLEQCTPEVN